MQSLKFETKRMKIIFIYFGKIAEKNDKDFIFEEMWKIRKKLGKNIYWKKINNKSLWDRKKESLKTKKIIWTKTDFKFYLKICFKSFLNCTKF